MVSNGNEEKNQTIKDYKNINIQRNRMKYEKKTNKNKTHISKIWKSFELYFKL